MIRMTIRCPFWEFCLRVYIGEPSKSFKRKTKEDFEGCSGFVQHGQFTNEFIMWLEEEPLTAQGLSVLSHEVMHLVKLVYQYHNIKQNKSCDEVPAMLHGYITSQVLKRYNGLD